MPICTFPADLAAGNVHIGIRHAARRLARGQETLLYGVCRVQFFDQFLFMYALHQTQTMLSVERDGIQPQRHLPLFSVLRERDGYVLGLRLGTVESPVEQTFEPTGSTSRTFTACRHTLSATDDVLPPFSAGCRRRKIATKGSIGETDTALTVAHDDRRRQDVEYFFVERRKKHAFRPLLPSDFHGKATFPPRKNAFRLVYTVLYIPA